ncbi:MAG: AMP-binding protein, partial [bacterium]|nr:AMP-binding protein [bacterium]
MNKLSKKNIEDILALTPMQEGMLFFHLKDPANGAYFEQLSLEVTGEIDTRTFEEAWNVVIKSNEMLRTFFRWEKMEKQVQIVLKEHRIQPTYYDFTPHPPEKKKKQLDDLRAKDREDGFNLGEVPFRISLAKIEKEKSVFIISNSHILYDGWSNGILLKEFFNVYSEISTGRPPEVQCKTKFKEFIKWNRDRDKGNEKRYWQEYLREYETQTGLSIKKVEKNNGTANGDKYRATTHKALAGQLERYAAKHKITPASVMYTAWGILLQKYNNSEQALFGTTVSGRNAKVKGIEEIVGLFINTLPLILKKTPGEKITAIVHRIDETLKKREQFEHTSLIDIKEYNKIENIEELFDTIVVIENYPLDKQLGKKAGNLSLQGFSMEEKSHYDLTVGITWFDGIEINFVYNSDKLEKGRVVKLAQHFKNILGEIITKTGEEDSSIEMITPAEKKQVLYEFNETTVEYPQDKNIRQLFQRQAEETPTGIAVVGPVQDMSSPGADGREPATVTYRQLNEQSSHLAHILQEKGVKPGAIVAIMAQRNVEMITALLGILEADAVYLPIDPDYPQERIDYLLKDSNATLLLTTHQLHKKTTLDKEVIYLNEIRNSASATRPPAPGSPHPASRPAY